MANRRVFVLGSGRCGTVTFSKACSHFTNFTVGHESCARKIGDARFGYPESHIEVDSRLTWFLGELGERFPDAYYIHLIRDFEATAESVFRKWHKGRMSFANAFAHSIVMHPQDWEDPMEVCRFQVRTANANIHQFLKSVQHRSTVRTEFAKDWFPQFCKEIGAKGNLVQAMNEWDNHYNSGASR